MFRHALMLTALLAGAPFVHAAEDTASTSAATTAIPMSEGEIKKIGTATGKLTVKHGPLDNLGTEPMTMVLRIQNPAMLSKVQVGSRARFVAEKVNGVPIVAVLEIQ